METLTKEQRKAILHERARKMALVNQSTDDVIGSSLRVARFALGNEYFCIETSFIREIISVKDITPLPGTPEFVEGIINVRGQIVSVLNPCKIFQIKSNEMMAMNKVIILSKANNEIDFGIVADRIVDTSDIATNQINPVPDNLLGSSSKYIRGISSEGYIIIDALGFISSTELIVNQTSEHK